MFRTTVRFAAALGVTALALPALAVSNPFTETFSGPGANWASASAGPGTAPLSYPASGGPDGSGYGSASFSFASAGVGTFPILFRARDSFNSSGDAFVGNWFAGGVSSFSFSVRQHSSVPLTFFARFVASGANTGVVYQVPATLAPDTWNTYSFNISSSTPFIYEGSPALFGSTFSNIDQVQIGIIADASIAGQAGPFTFDVDNVSIVPAPGAVAMALCVGGLAARRRRR